MIVKARLGDVQGLGDVGVTEGIEAARLHQLLGNVQNLLRGVFLIHSLVHRCFPIVPACIDLFSYRDSTIDFYLSVDKLPINR
jgi:hypothetical protein